MRVIFLLLAVYAFIACTNDKTASEPGSKNMLPEKGVEVEKQSLEHENGKLELLTTIDNTTQLESFQSDLTEKIIIDQKLKFYNKQGEIQEQSLPTPKTYEKTKNNDSIQILDNIIYELGILKGKNFDLYSVKGSGHCNACPEFFALYSMDGKCLWYQYSNTAKSFMQFGNFKETCSNSGIDSTKWMNGNYKKVEW